MREKLLFGVRALLFIVPLFSLWISASMLFPYVTGRNFAFRIVIELALVLWIALMVADERYRPKRSLFTWVIIALLLIVGAADFFGVNPYNSFWSRYERMEGYLSFLHFGVYALMLVSVFTSKRIWRAFFHVVIGAGLISGIYALLQRLDVLASIQGGDRVDGTIGNPTYLAAYLLFILGLIAYYGVLARQRWVKYAYGGVALFTLVIIYFTASRGPILSLVAAALLFPILYLFVGHRYTDQEKKSLYKKVALAVLVGSIVLPAGFLLVKDTSFVASSPVLSRFANISFTEQTTRARFMVWGMAWEGFTERPLLGWGQENFIDVFTKHYNPRLFDQEPYFDRSHNIILDWLISAGILGFVAYLGLFAVTFIVLWRLLKGRRFGFLEFAVLSLTLTAYFIQNLFVFDNFSTYFLFFAILAYVQAATGFDGDVRGGAFQGKLEDKHALRAVIAGGVALVFMVPVAYTVNIKPIQESRSLINALRFISEKGALAGTLERFDKTFSYRTFGDREAAEQMNTIANQVAAAKGIPIEEQVHFLEETVTVLEKQAEVVSRNLKAHTALGSLYNLLSPVDSSYVAKANEHIMKAISISPTRQNSYFLLADNLVIQNDVDGALDALREAVALAPEFIIPQSNLAFVALAFDRTAITDEVYEELDGLVEGRKSDADAAALARIGSRYIERGDGERALRWYDLAIRANEGIPQHHAIIAELYLVQGDAEQAIFHAMRAAELDPKNFKEQIDAFLNQLGE